MKFRARKTRAKFREKSEKNKRKGKNGQRTKSICVDAQSEFRARGRRELGAEPEFDAVSRESQNGAGRDGGDDDFARDGDGAHVSDAAHEGRRVFVPAELDRFAKIGARGGAGQPESRKRAPAEPRDDQQFARRVDDDRAGEHDVSGVKYGILLRAFLRGIFRGADFCAGIVSALKFL